MKLVLPESETPGLLGKRAIITKVLSVAKLLGPLCTTLVNSRLKQKNSCQAGHARCTERVRELIAADPPDEGLIQTLWAMQATGQLTDEVRSRNPTLVQAWALAEANPPPHQLQAMLAALAAQHLNGAEAAEAA